MKNFIEQIARKYSWQYGGMLAWLIQRVTGVLLLFYLFLHIRTVHRLSQGPEAFNEAMAFFQRPAFKLLEVALLGTVILHALNGVRITILDLGLGHVLAAVRLDSGDLPETKVFHAGTGVRDGHIVTAGGRVLCICALARP